jgi:hypothetical protein
MHLLDVSWQSMDLKAKHRCHIHFIQIGITLRDEGYTLRGPIIKLYQPAIAFACLERVIKLMYYSTEDMGYEHTFALMRPPRGDAPLGSQRRS